MWHAREILKPRLVVLNFCKLKSTTYNYQYMQHSKIPMMHFQASLPRLPVPKLEKTCERYLAAQRPLLIEEAFRKTESNVNRFMQTIGKSLQQQLIKQDKGNKMTSYITEPWFDKYLKDRSSLPINSNPMLVFQNDHRHEYCDQTIRTANLLISSLRFYKSLKEGILEPEVFHLNPQKSDNDKFRKVCALAPNSMAWYFAYLHNAYPLDMSQYHCLFNTTRIPETDKDRIYSGQGRHVSVQYKGNFYIFDALDEGGNIIEPNKVLSTIRSILLKTDVAEYPVGILTTMERNKWATVRHNLLALGNERTLKMIDSALFNICLDDIVIGQNKYELVRNFLHGDGKNRWFDKSISLQLSKDGYAAINFEHSWGDGVAVLRFFQDIHKDSISQPQVHPNTSSVDPASVEKLEFNLDDQAKAVVREAEKDYEEVWRSLDVNFVESEGLGKKFCKQYSISPDAVMQMCFQSAYYKQFGKFVPTYESCSTAAFKHGRTEVIRPCTTATKDYCLASNSVNKPSNSELVHMIKECSKMHGQLTKEAAMGQGFDRHLFALQLLANKVSAELPHANIFEDPAFLALNHNILSTSTLSSPAVIAGGFGPVVRDGFGVGYVIRDNAMGTLATSYPGMDGKEFIEALKKSIEELVTTLTTSKN